MKQFNITGMSCAACQARIEKTVKKMENVDFCSVNLLTNTMSVEGTASENDIISAVKKAGYGAYPKKSDVEIKKNSDLQIADNEEKSLKSRLISSLIFLAFLMYISMGNMLFGFPLPSFLANNQVSNGILQLILCGIIMFINKKFFVSGFKAAFHLSPNMDTLVALGSFSSFCMSLYSLFGLSDSLVRGISPAEKWMNGLYFDSAAMILTLITVGKLLEAKSKGKTTSALKSLMSLAPEKACVIKDGKEITVNINEVKQNDIFVVRPGEKIPADGVILEGETSVNEASLTGESIPVDKKENDCVSCATINQNGFIRCRATRVGEDTSLSKIIKMVSDVSATKAPIAKIADKVAGIFVPSVLAISVVTLTVWLLIGRQFGFALERAISVLVISCPCALGLATPVAVMAGNGTGAKNGILFKTAVSLEQTGKTDIVILDKTGTVTEGVPEVNGIFPAENITEEQLLSLAYSLEIKSEHPLASAVVRKAKEQNTVLFETDAFKVFPGNGLCAEINGKKTAGGSLRFISEQVYIDNIYLDILKNVSDKGATPILFAQDGIYMGVISVSDKIKQESREAVGQLEKTGVEVVMLTGDNMKTAKEIAAKAGIENVVADVLPEEKAEIVNSLKKFGNTAMVGDGINDAPALVSADIGIAIGAGTDVAIESADVVLMNSRLTDVPAAITLSRMTLRNIRQNLFWAFFYNVIGIPLAAGCFIPLFGWELKPVFGAAAMSLSSFFVVTNALRLGRCNIHSVLRNKSRSKKSDHGGIADMVKKINNKKEIKIMVKTIRVEGMMCSHCEAHVKKALESVEGVVSATADHNQGTAVVTLKCEVETEKLRAAVENEGYIFISVD